MLKGLIDYINTNQGSNNTDQYLDARYVRLTDEHYTQIAEAMSNGGVAPRNASSCPAERFFLHFKETILFVNRNSPEKEVLYSVDMAQEAEIITSTTNESEQNLLNFVSFSFDDDYQPSLIHHDLSSRKNDNETMQRIMNSVTPVLRAFMCAISE